MAVLILDTTYGQDGLRQCQVVIRVGIQQGVAVADGRVVVGSIHTSTVGIGLVRLVLDIVYTLGMRDTG